MFSLTYNLSLAPQIQKGAWGARSDDTKSLKSAIIDWITPPRQSLSPPIAQNVKMERGFHHKATGALLCPAALDWSDPVFVSLCCLWDHHFYGGFRVKAGLRNGDILVSGDNWPIFLSKDYKYDPEDIWNGLLRSNILV